MSSFQKYLPIEVTTLDRYVAFTSGMHSALSTLGFVQTNDKFQIQLPQITARLLSASGNGTSATFTYDSLSGGAFAVNQQVVISDCRTQGFDTKATLTRVIAQTAQTVTLTQAIRQTTQSVAITSVSVSSSNMTCTGANGGGVNTFQNWAFTAAGFDNAGNNGTFMCVSSTATTIVLDNPTGVNETPSGSPTLTSNANWTSYLGGSNGTDNAFQFWVFSVSGFSNGGNNFTPDAAFSTLASSSTAFAVVNASGVNETHAGTGTSVLGQVQYIGTITGGASNSLKGQPIVISGFSGSNKDNGQQIVVSSSSTQISVTFLGAANESPGNAYFGISAKITAVTTTSPTAGTFTVANPTNLAETESSGNNLAATNGVVKTVAHVGPYCTITNVQSSGTTAIYTYSGLHGTLRIGQLITINGTATNAGGFNQTQFITAFTGTTFTVVGNNNGTIGLTNDSGIATCTSVQCVPGQQAGTFVENAPYEIWGSNDGLTQYFAKIAYTLGSTSSGSTPAMMSVRLATGTDGAGNTTGGQTLREYLCYAGASTINQHNMVFECNFFGGGNGSSFAAMLWRDAGTSLPCAFGWERGKDNTGADSGNFVTLVQVAGPSTNAHEHTLQLTGPIFTLTSTGVSSGSFAITNFPASIVSNSYINFIFTVTGATNPQNNGTFITVANGLTTLTLSTDFAVVTEATSLTIACNCGVRDIDWSVINRVSALPASWQVGNNVMVSPIFPNVGFFSNPLTMFVVGTTNDFVEGQIIKVTIHNTSHPYLVSKASPLAYAGGGSAVSVVGIRMD